MAAAAAAPAPPRSLATASGLLLGTLCAVMGFGALGGWLAGAPGLGLLVGAIVGIPAGVAVVYITYTRAGS